MEKMEQIEKVDAYNQRKVDEVIELEVSMVEKSEAKRGAAFLRRSMFAVGVLSLFFLRNELSSENINYWGVALGAIFTGTFFGVYFAKKGQKDKFENDLILARQDYNREIDNLDLDGINMLNSRREELGLTKKKKK